MFQFKYKKTYVFENILRGKVSKKEDQGRESSVKRVITKFLKSTKQGPLKVVFKYA